MESRAIGGTKGILTMKEIIKQLLPVPESLTPMLRAGKAEGKYTDASEKAKAVFIALMDDIVFGSYTVFYVVDSDGDGEFAEEDDVRLVPTVHCRACGQRMMAGTTPAKPDHVIYRCPCGEVRITEGNDKG